MNHHCWIVLAALTVMFRHAAVAQEQPQTIDCGSFAVVLDEKRTVVVRVDAESGVGRAGLQQGDQLLTFCGVPATKTSALQKAATKKGPEDVVTMTVMRNGKRLRLQGGGPLTQQEILGQYLGAKLRGETVAVVDLNAPAHVQAAQQAAVNRQKAERQAEAINDNLRRLTGAVEDQTERLGEAAALPAATGERVDADSDEHLTRAEKLTPGNQIVAAGKKYELRFTRGGSVVLSNKQTDKWLWSVGSEGSGASQLVVQDDGNVVLSRPDGSVVWASDSHGRDGSRLIVQDDGNLVLYAGEKAVWATNTHGN